MHHALAAGERILLIDPKERRYLITLVEGATFHTHAGVIAHDSIIGGEEGRTITGSTVSDNTATGGTGGATNWTGSGAGFIDVYAAGANGTVPPIATIGGGTTGTTRAKS